MKKLLAVSVFAFLFIGQVMAQATPSEAYGTILDHEGNPLKGVELEFTPANNPALTYKGKTNKKGKYFISGLFSSQGDRWNIKLVLEGYGAVEMTLESRTVNKVLIGDIQTTTLKPQAAIPEIPIKPLGKAKVDFKMMPTDLIQAGAAATQAANVAAVQPKQQPKKQDPWDEALQLAAGPDKAAAIPLFEKAVEDEPEDAQRREVFAKVLYQLERYDEAETQALKAVELAPDNLDSHMVLFTTYVNKNDYDNAGKALDKAEEVAPGDVRVLLRRASLASHTGDTAGEIAAYEKVVAADETHKSAWVSLGQLYADAGNLSKSEEAYRKVVEIDPDGAHQTFFNLGALRLKTPRPTSSDTEKAVAAFRKAIEIKPDYAKAHRELALALLGTGDRAGARGSLESYVKFAPDAPDAAQMQRLIDTLKN